MSDRYGHKDYQNATLESLREYWRECLISGNPETAFIKTTSEIHGMAHPCHKIGELGNGTELPEDMPFVCLRVPTGGGKTVFGARAIRVFKEIMSAAIACSPGHLILTTLQPEGKRRMDAAAFLRGHPLPPGSRFGL